MSEVSGGAGGGFDEGGGGEASAGAESLSGGELSAGGREGVSVSGEMAELAGEAAIHPSETTSGMNQILETPATMEEARQSIENYHQQSIAQILEGNGSYLSEADKARISNGVDELQAVAFDPAKGNTGGYRFLNGESRIEVSAINQQQMERSTKHETNHFASKHQEIIVPDPERKGYMVYNTVGTRQASWFHSNETGQNSEFTCKGRGLNEGLTTLYTNQQLTELSPEKGAAAERQGIYAHATELCGQLESIVGKDALKEAYYGGDLQGLEARVDQLAGGKEFAALRECLDRTLSSDYTERVEAMKEAQDILAKMYESEGRQRD